MGMHLISEGEDGMYKYTLSDTGKQKVKDNQFFGQNLEHYKGYTEKVFRTLYNSIESLTLRQLVEKTNCESTKISQVINYNKRRGYIIVDKSE